MQGSERAYHPGSENSAEEEALSIRRIAVLPDGVVGRRLTGCHCDGSWSSFWDFGCLGCFGCSVRCFLVFGSWFLVLGSWFVVRGSWFSRRRQAFLFAFTIRHKAPSSVERLEVGSCGMREQMQHRSTTLGPLQAFAIQGWHCTVRDSALLEAWKGSRVPYDKVFPASRFCVAEWQSGSVAASRPLRPLRPFLSTVWLSVVSRNGPDWMDEGRADQ